MCESAPDIERRSPRFVINLSCFSSSNDIGPYFLPPSASVREADPPGGAEMF